MLRARRRRERVLPGLARLRWCWLRNAHVGPGHASHLGDGIVRQIDRRVRLADRFLVRPGHEAEGLALLQIHVRGVTERAEALGGLLERVELLEELLLAELLLREAAFGLVVGVDEVFHVDAPVSSIVVHCRSSYRVYTQLNSRIGVFGPAASFLLDPIARTSRRGCAAHAARMRSCKSLRMASHRRSPSLLRSVC